MRRRVIGFILRIGFVLFRCGTARRVIGV
jgi:hypothetical protein